MRSPPSTRSPRADALVAVVSLVGACYVFVRLLADADGVYLRDSVSDQTLFEWFFSATAQALADGESLLEIDAQNAPEGINGMANTTVLALSIPLAPVTLVWGPQTTFAVIMVCGMAATCYTWYWLFSRYLVALRPAAALGGVLCAFSPAMISHANGHLNMVVHFAVPLALGVFLRLGTTRRPVRFGVLLGVLAATQIMIGEEMLLIAALGFAVFIFVYCVQRWDVVRQRWRGTLIGTATGVGVAGCLVGYPLWYQFAGPMHYHGLPAARLIHNTLASFAAFSTRSLLGDATTAAALTGDNPTEENGFLGWPLLSLVLAILIWRRREPVVRTACVTGILFAVVSLGSPIRLDSVYLLSDVVVGRYAFVAIPMVAIVVMRGFEALRSLVAAKRRREGRSLTLIGMAVAYAVLLPIFPTPLVVEDRDEVPELFTTDAWREYVPENGVLVAVPLPYAERSWALDWQMAADMGFRLAGGYFVGPSTTGGCQPGCYGRYGAPARPTGELMLQVARTGEVPTVSADDRLLAWIDLSYWEADAVVLDPDTAPHADELKTTMDDLLGEGVFDSGVWVWSVTDLLG